eukprot:1157309-Pelagomonas_calceolata.AAC.1
MCAVRMQNHFEWLLCKSDGLWCCCSPYTSLFRKFDGLVQARSLGDSLRLLDLLKKLAESDTSHVSVAQLCGVERCAIVLENLTGSTASDDKVPLTTGATQRWQAEALKGPPLSLCYFRPPMSVAEQKWQAEALKG